MGVHQLLQSVLQPGKRNKQMPAAAEGNRGTADCAYRLLQVFRLQHRAAFITLIPPSAFPADRAEPFHETIRQKGMAAFTVGLRHLLFINIRAFIQFFMELTDKILMRR